MLQNKKFQLFPFLLSIALLFTFSIITFLSGIANVNAGIMYSTRVLPNPSINTFNPLYGPRDVTVDKSGNIYIVDGDFNRIRKVNPNGVYISQWGHEGAGQGEFYGPFGIELDNNGILFVSDSANNRIQKFTQNGTFVGEFGSAGTGSGQFDYPSGLFIDKSNNLFVTDTNNNRIQKFDNNGNFLMEFGQYGTGNGDMWYPQGIYVDSTGVIYVADSANCRIQKFTSTGEYISQFGTRGTEPGQFATANAILGDGLGNLYISDMNNNRIQKFTTGGTYLSIYINSDRGLFLPHGMVIDSHGNFILANWGMNEVRKFTSNGADKISIGANGKQADQLSNPQDFVIDSSDNLIVSDTDHNLIKKFNKEGGLLMSFGAFGSGNGQFDYPVGVDVDTLGNIYVLDANNYRVQKFDSTGHYIMQFGEYGSDLGQFQGPQAIALDLAGNIFIFDNQKYTVAKFSPLGTFIVEFGGNGAAEGELSLILGGEIAPNGDVYVADGFNHRISVFDNDGIFIKTFASSDPAQGGLSLPGDVTFDSLGNIYVMDPNGNKVHKFDSNTDYVESFGILGGRAGEMYYPYSIQVDSGDNVYTLSPAPSDSGFVTKWNSGYQIILNSNSIDVKNSLGSLKQGSSLGSYSPTEQAQLMSGFFKVSDFTVNMTQDRDWPTVEGDTDMNLGKSFVKNLTPASAPGISATHTLYIPKLPNQTGVHICPDASALVDVQLNCTGGYSVQQGDANLSVSIDGVYQYWVISGLTGTGGLGLSLNAPSAPFVLVPNSSDVNTTQEVLMQYSSSIGFVAGNKIEMHFESSAGFVLSNTCLNPTTDANFDSVSDGSASIVGAGSDIYEYVFNAPINAGAMEFCVNVTSPAAAGSYSVRLTDDNGTFAIALYYVGGDNEVFILANVSPSLSFNIRNLEDTADTNSCDFGTVSASTALPNYDSIVDIGSGECGYALAVGTNAVNGFQTQISANHELSSGMADIAFVSPGGTYIAGVEAYGLANITTSSSGRDEFTGVYDQSILKDGGFNLFANTATNIPLVSTDFVSYPGGVQYVSGIDANDVTKIVHGLVVGSGTPAGYYDQVITYTTTGRF